VKKLEDIISKYIAPAMLERVITDQNLIGKAQRNALFKQTSLLYPYLVAAVVEAYGANAPRLAHGLYRQIDATDWEAAQRLKEHLPAAADLINHQASLVGRIPTLALRELAQFLTDVTGQICLIVSRNGTGKVLVGTGFLVGPNLVLTCRHVLDHICDNADITGNGSRIEIYFDFDLGEPVETLSPDLPLARKVMLDPNWRVASGTVAKPDGLDTELDEGEIRRIKEALDFILLRLAEPVGLQPIERGGGRQRKWVDVSTAAVAQTVEDEDWIIIPQHPYGKAQRIDLGRFRELDQTETRLRYDTNTAKGSSGAPCFNQKFKLVGVHNAYVGPEENPRLNQAIRANLIARLIQPHLDPNVTLTSYLPRWSVAAGNEVPRVILGRGTLLNWLQADAATPTTIARRVYCAHADVPKAGCSFSIEILHAEIRGSKSPRAVYGDAGQILPATVEDFLLSLTRELGIVTPSKEIPRRPAPPSNNPATIGIGEVDKLGRWISQELPEWLGDVINAHVQKEIDVRESAKKSVADLEAQGIEVPKKLQANADSKVPVIIRPNAWDHAYVVFDDLRSGSYPLTTPRTELRGEVQDLVAALVLPKSEAAMHTGLRRLRWMFLGYVPDFLPTAGGGATIEILDPEKVGVEEIETILTRLSQAHLPVPKEAKKIWPAMAKLVVRAALSRTEPKLVSLQSETNFATMELLAPEG
jgi:hypothetical protein